MIFFTDNCYCLNSMIARKNLKNGELSPCPSNIHGQIWPKVNSFGSRGHQVKIIIFRSDGFSLITFLIWEVWKWKLHHCGCLVKLVQNMHSLTLKGQFQNLSSGQVKVRSWPKLVNMNIFRSRLKSQVIWHHLCICISILLWVIGEKWIVTSCDLRWPSCNSWPSIAPRSSQMGSVTMILKKLGGFSWFMQNGKHFNFSP